MNKLKGYSLWIIPEDAVYEKYRSVINSLSLKFATPVFEPHITLCGQIEISKDEILKKTAELAKSVKPFPVLLSGFDMQTSYYRALYVTVEISQHIINTYEKTLKMFNIMKKPPYIPHLSLLYGNLPHNIKQTIVEDITGYDTASFTAGSVHVVSTSGNIYEWCRVREFPFLNKE